jgi:hypothetical protein
MSYQRSHHEDTHHQDAPVTAGYTLDGPTRDGRPRLPTTAEQQLFRYHHRVGNVSFPKASSPTPGKMPNSKNEMSVRKSNKTKTEKQTFQSEPRQPGLTVTVDNLGPEWKIDESWRTMMRRYWPLRRSMRRCCRRRRSKNEQ